MMNMHCVACAEDSIVEGAFTAGFVERQCVWCGYRQTIMVDAIDPPGTGRIAARLRAKRSARRHQQRGGNYHLTRYP